MSKKINNVAINATTTEAEAKASLKEYFEKYENVSLRKLAVATNSTYGIMLKYSKQPIVGEAYDPEATNWSAVEAYLTKRGVKLDEVDWEALNETTSRKSSVVKDMSKFNVGDKVYIRKQPATPYTVLYKTDTHIVIMLDGTSEPLAWANNTFLLNGPQFEPRAEKVDAAEVDTNNEVEQSK